MIYNLSKYNQEWNTFKLTDLGKFSRGKSKHRPRNDKKLFENGKYPLIQTGDIKKATLFAEGHSQAYNDFGLKQSKMWDSGTLCITIAANIAETAIIKYPMCFPDSVVGFRASSETSEIFMHYIFCFIQKHIKNIAIGSIQDNINIEYLTSLEFKIPNKEYQDKILAILYAIDQKISLNNRIIAKLEEMAKTIYEYWFLQFDFPNDEGKPYRQSGGAMQYSKELGREIPADWEVLNLDERFEFVKGIEIGSSQYQSEWAEGRILFWRVGDMNGTCSTYADEGLFDDLLLQPKDICVSFDGSVGKVDFGLIGGYSSGLRKIYDKEEKINSSVIYQIFKSGYIQNIIHKYATGSNILHASSSIKNMRLPYNERMFDEFQKIVTPMFDKMVQAKQENQKLAELRDWLLPMLMNGQARAE